MTNFKIGDRVTILGMAEGTVIGFDWGVIIEWDPPVPEGGERSQVLREWLSALVEERG